MVSKKMTLCLCLSAIWFLASCGRDEDYLSWSDYQQWMGQESSQLVKSKNVNNIDISSRYVPADYLGYRDLLSNSSIIDSLSYQNAKSNYQCGLTFRVEIVPESKGINLLYHKVDSENAYKTRVNVLSFKADEFISMSIADHVYTPVLANYEGYNELQNRLVYTVVFKPDEFDCGTFKKGVEEVTLTFEDPFWSTGVNHFTYGISTLSDIPQILLN